MILIFYLVATNGAMPQKGGNGVVTCGLEVWEVPEGKGRTIPTPSGNAFISSMDNSLIGQISRSTLKRVLLLTSPAAVLTAVTNINDNMVLMTMGNMVFRCSPY
jgi:hypothetical protein